VYSAPYPQANGYVLDHPEKLTLALQRKALLAQVASAFA
jgi:hypothetical protein